MHIALKKIKFDLERYLKRGSEEQIDEIYDIVYGEYCKTERGMKEVEKDNSNKELLTSLKKQIKELQKSEVVEQDSGTQNQEANE